MLKDMNVPVPQEDIKFRKGPGGDMLAYIDGRTAMDMLDKCVGPANWSSEIKAIVLPSPTSQRGYVHAKLTVTEEGVVKSVEDIGEFELTGMDGPKGGFSDALKRCCVQLGFGRDLYSMGKITKSDPRVTQAAQPRPAKVYEINETRAAVAVPKPAPDPAPAPKAALPKGDTNPFTPSDLATVSQMTLVRKLASKAGDTVGDTMTKQEASDYIKKHIG